MLKTCFSLRDRDQERGRKRKLVSGVRSQRVFLKEKGSVERVEEGPVMVPKGQKDSVVCPG